MPLAFRNVNASPADPVATWPTEAVQAALERGDLEHWQRLTAEILRDPWGRTAQQVDEVLGYCRPYGVVDLMEAVLDRARERAAREERDVVATEVREAIARSGLGRAEFAARIGTSPSRLSTYATGRVVPSATLMLRMRRAASSASSSPE